MKKQIFIFLFFAAQIACAKQQRVYVLVWGSTQTYSGAGHVSVAFQSDSSVEYFSHYPEGDGGGIHLIRSSMAQVINVDQHELGLQNEKPNLVLSFKVTEREYGKMLATARKKIERKWSLFVINCADFTKQVFRNSNYDLGLAFGISTPVELVKDLSDHNQEEIENGSISIKTGDVLLFIKNQPRAVPLVIRNWWRRLFKKDHSV